MWVELELLTSDGLLNYMYMDSYGEKLEFGAIKKEFRGYLDTNFDHHLLLHKNDPWAKVLQDVDQHNASGTLPGLKTIDGDPTTEYFAFIIAGWAAHKFRVDVNVVVQETEVNAAQASASYLG